MMRVSRGVPALEAIEGNSVPEPNTGCWLWTASVNNWGYGRFGQSHAGERAAHRVSFVARSGHPIPVGMLVLHRCDTPSCVNPDHLFLGSSADNAEDMCRKGRLVAVRGERQGNAKLTWEAVREIRVSDEKVSDLAKRFRVSRRAIAFVLERQTWKE